MKGSCIRLTPEAAEQIEKSIAAGRSIEIRENLHTVDIYEVGRRRVFQIQKNLKTNDAEASRK